MAEDIPAEYPESYRSSLNSQDDTPLMLVQHIRPAPQYPNTTAKEDEEDRKVVLKWDLLQPAFIAAFRKGLENFLCLGLALPSALPGHLVLMSLEFYSLDKSEYIGQAKAFDPFEFVVMNGSEVLDGREDRDERLLHLENETHQFEYSLTKQETWRVRPKTKAAKR